jgi:ribonucleoside-diphosphate reductase alpha chain
MDQAISVNFSYNPAFYEDSEVPMSELIQHMLLHYKWGGKTGYYLNTNDEAGEADDCDSCKI